MIPLLDLRDLRVSFRGPGGAHLPAVDGLSLRVPPRASVGIVGESGCGKSTVALSVLRLVPSPPARLEGQVLFRPGGAGPPVDLLHLPEPALRAIRGARISMIFQEPMTSLNPVYTVGNQIGEALRVHRGLSRREANAEAERLLRQVGIGDPARRQHEYPHQLSGGMRQRVMIAMALSCGPDLLIADEPTTALDATVQAQILDLLRALQAQLGMAVLLITHELGLVSELCSEVVVMYAGQIVEQGPTPATFAAPRHPYTAGLLRSLPRLDEIGPVRRRLPEIPGLVPTLGQAPPGCRFQDRCPRAQARCREEPPPLLPSDGEPGRLVRCHFPLSDTPPPEAAS